MELRQTNVPAPARLLGVAAMAVALAGCPSGRPAVLGPVPEPGVRAAGIERSTRLDAPLQIRFRWQLNEAGSRAGGQGVARVEPPYRARLDLFMEGSLEHVLAAALVDDELRLPPGSRDDILPPVDLMWGALGVFRPAAGSTLLGGDRLDDTAHRFRYGIRSGEELHYEVLDGTLRSVELLQGDAVVQWVRVAAEAGDSYPNEATYRNLQDYRELKITRDTIIAAAPFDPDIWDPR